MKINYGTVIAVAAALIFYLRLIILQRQRVKRMRIAYQAQSSKRKKKANRQEQQSIVESLGLKIISWYALSAGIVFIILGAVISIAPWLSSSVRELWWVAVTLGILVLGFTVK